MIHDLSQADRQHLRVLFAAAHRSGFLRPGEAVVGTRAHLFRQVHASTSALEEREQARRLFRAVTEDRAGARNLAEEALLEVAR